MYNQYYTASDCNVYLSKNNNNILVDKMNGIMISEELNSYPVYGLGSSLFGFTTRGNYIVNGLLDINFTHSAYLTNAINSLEKKIELGNISNISANALQNQNTLISMSVADIEQLKQNIKDNPLVIPGIGLDSFNKSSASANGISYLKSGFNIQIHFNNSNELKEDGMSSIIEVVNCRIISSDISSSVNDESQLIRRYRFIGQVINEQSRKWSNYRQ